MRSVLAVAAGFGMILQTPPHPDALLACSAGLGFVFGLVLHRSHFCTMGAVTDIVATGDWTRMRVWALAIAVAIAGLQAGSLAWGWDVTASFYASPRVFWLSHLLGGLLFGCGMVMASGCGSKTLVRLGSGNLKALVTLLTMSIVALISLKGVLAELRVNVLNAVFIDLPVPATLPHLLDHWLGRYPVDAAHALAGSAVPAQGRNNATGPSLIAALLPFFMAVMLTVLVLKDSRMREMRQWLPALIMGLVITGAWSLTLQAGFVAEDPQTLEPAWLATYSGRPEALTFTAPVAHWLEWLAYHSDGSRRLSMGMLATLGVVAGAFISARLQGPIRIEGFRQTEDLKRHIAGGAFMGFGGVLGLGCTVGQGMSGVATLSPGSILTLAGILAGAVWQLRRDFARI